MQNRVSLLIALGTLFVTLPIAAHHSHANYRTTSYVNLEGTVTEVHWMNPHTWIYLEVMDAGGEPIIWALEGASPTELRADGWTRDDVKVGDNIKVRCHQLFDGSNGCLLGFVTPEGGVEKEYD
jgi:hypothetical protein